jgi:NTP pyrophosphatase (non-canonical NTP hydrolase)
VPLIIEIMMNEIEKEIMLIAQEECAEVTQAISKVFRFGFESVHNDKTNKQRLEEEIGDLMCMLQLMDEKKLIDWSMVSVAASMKREKLKQWSDIFKPEYVN